MERELNEDPMTYETRPIFGMWSKRQTAIGAAVLVATAALAALAWRLGADPMYVGGACALAGIPVGVFALSRRHGLLPEEWMPLARAEREAPREMVWTPAVPATAEETDGGAPTRRELRRIARVRRMELEDDDLLGALLGEPGEDLED